jgi:hypothetical protein
MENKGHEITITWADKTKFGLRYSIGVNASFNRNLMKNIDVYGNGAPETRDYNDWTGQSLTYTADGLPVAMLYGYKVIGIFESQEQVDEYNQMARDKTGVSTMYYYNSRTGVGDLIYADLSGKGYVDASDKTPIGNTWPKALLGINLNFEYKGFDLSMNFQSALGFDIYNLTKKYTQGFYGLNSTAEYFNASFLGENGLTDQPRVGRWTNNLITGALEWQGDNAVNQNYSIASSYFVEKGDYLKLKNLVIGYTLPQKALKKMKMQQLRVYMSAQNVFTLTKYSGIDPEIGAIGGNVLRRNLDTFNRYLPSRLFSFGIDLTF